MNQRDIHTSRSVITEPRANPIDLDEAKEHIRFTANTQDEVINSFITAARYAAESITWRKYELTTMKLYLDRFPRDIIEVEPGPVRSIESIEYIDGDGNTQTVSSSAYNVDLSTEPARVERDEDSTWPIPDDRVNSVIVTFKTGYEVAIDSVDTGTDTITAKDHWFSNGEVVRVRVSGGNTKNPPGGLKEDTDYYVINVSGNTLQLSATSGGSAISITSSGVGTSYIYDPPMIPASDLTAMKLLIGHFDKNRESVVVTNSSLSVEEIPQGAKWLLGYNSMERP